MTAPDRIWCHPTERQPVPAKDRRNAKWVRGGWKDHNSNAHGDVEYVRADLAAVQPAQVRVKPLVWTGGDIVAATGLMLRREGVVLDRGRVAQFEQERADEILSLLEPQPDPRDEVIARLVEAATEALSELEVGGKTMQTVRNLRAALAAAKAVQHG